MCPAQPEKIQKDLGERRPSEAEGPAGGRPRGQGSPLHEALQHDLFVEQQRLWDAGLRCVNGGSNRRQG